jgi:hypothetical protein
MAIRFSSGIHFQRKAGRLLPRSRRNPKGNGCVQKVKCKGDGVIERLGDLVIGILSLR